MRKKQDSIVQGKQLFVDLEDSKRTWKLCVRSGGMIVHETSIPAESETLRAYLQARYPDCQIRLMYEAGFGGLWLHDRLVADGKECIVTPPHTVTQQQVTTVKTDRVEARRLTKFQAVWRNAGSKKKAIVAGCPQAGGAHASHRAHAPAVLRRRDRITKGLNRAVRPCPCQRFGSRCMTSPPCA